MSYPEGMSMLGSGIYSYEQSVSFSCEFEVLDSEGETLGVCDFDGTVLGWVDDWGNLTAECPRCGYITEF